MNDIKWTQQIKIKLKRLNYKLKYDFFKFDNMILLIAAGFCLAWTWGAISSVSRNWELEQRLIARRTEKELLQLEVETLALENQYYASEEYQELAAREKQGKKLDGETMIYLPENSEMAKTKYEDQVEVKRGAKEEPSNLEQWLMLLFGA